MMHDDPRSVLPRTLDRHRWLALCSLVLILLALAAAVRAATSRAASKPAKPTIVLVHGAWADGSSWAGEVALLQAKGYQVDVAPNPLRGVASDARSLGDYLSTISGPVVLVGHSYGGMVITNAATGDPNVKALVYVDAFIPADGETLLQLATARGSCLSGGGDPSKVFNFVPYPGAPSGDVDLYIKAQRDAPFPGFDRCFANDLPRRVANVLQATQSPIALSALTEPSGPPAWASIPSWSVIGTADQVIPPAEQAFMSKRAGARITRIHGGSHLDLISRPRRVTAVIVSAANAVS